MSRRRDPGAAHDFTVRDLPFMRRLLVTGAAPVGDGAAYVPPDLAERLQAAGAARLHGARSRDVVVGARRDRLLRILACCA